MTGGALAAPVAYQLPLPPAKYFGPFPYEPGTSQLVYVPFPCNKAREPGFGPAAASLPPLGMCGSDAAALLLTGHALEPCVGS